MGLEKRTVKIIVIVAVVLLVIGAVLGLILGLLLHQRYVELEVWPRSEEYTWEQPLIQFRPSDTGSWHPWFRRMNEFLKAYETTIPEDPPRAPCSTRNKRDDPIRSNNCEIAMRMWAPCTADEFYGYNMGRPCVFLRLNHIHYWVPHPYNVSTSLPIPPEMPENMKQFMMNRPAQHFGDYVWVSCGGEYNSDKENIGPIQYIPAGLPPGFPLSRLHTADKIPYANRNLPDQIPPPLIAVYFENPRREVLINVECRIWTRDIYYDQSSRVGRARFELFVNN
ncbi:sodium/potassium-transporting ATPase subunit beta-2-like [Ostrinia nubilalis]|uniref:sodium/potassium-transporting ATPase subunit beta-2-like n=1 Tax=Ostrinia furnacalis TaxID=93504 RepID=UPI00103F1F83|nr:sodium/potassium-transporting ATPase subunit beta-2-like [Ostrinia furnacalis]